MLTGVLHRALLLVVLGLAWAAPPAPAAGPAFLGAQVHPLWETSDRATVARELDLLVDLGANVARADVGWSSLQGVGPGTFDRWYVERLDTFVAAAHARGIRVIATLTETPCWASSAPEELRRGCAGAWWERGVQDFAPRDPRDYARAARFLTARYGTRLAALELWNEPNLPGEFHGAGGRAARYAALVRATYGEAKAGDPRVPVIVGSTSHSDTAFLARLYARGIAGHHDGISIHPYSDGRSPTSTASDVPARLEFERGIRAVRALQRRVGQLRPVWLTEFGYTSCASEKCVSEADQARFTAESVATLARLRFVRGATLYQLRDMAQDPADEEQHFGLVRTGFEPRPVYAAFKAAVAAVRAAGR